MKTEEKIAECCNCGGRNVDVRGWVNQETGEIDFPDIIEDDDTYCNDCEEHCGIIWVEK